MDWGVWSIDEELFNLIVSTLGPGSRLLELGSGKATQEFISAGLKVTSIEQNSLFSKGQGTIIHAPLVDGWYDLDIIKDKLVNDYQGILVDGPKGSNMRDKFWEHKFLFNLDVPLFLDDINRRYEAQMFNKFSVFFPERKHEIVKTKYKVFGVIYAQS